MSQKEQDFVATMSSWLVALPHDIKVLYEAADDENLDRAIRELAVGAIIYVIAPSDFIADRHDSFLSYCDDCLLLHVALQKMVADEKNEDVEYFKSRFPEFFDTLDDELTRCKDYLGDLYDWLAARIDTLPGLEYKGKKVAVYLDDDKASEFLYEDGLAFRTEYDVDEENLADSFKKGSSVLALLERRKQEEDKKRAV